MYALITPDGLVKNNIYGFENCDISILSSPLLGASFTDYIITVKENGRNLCGIGNESEEIFLFVIEGSLLVYNDNEKAGLTENTSHLIIYHQKQYLEILITYHIKILKKWIVYL